MMYLVGMGGVGGEHDLLARLDRRRAVLAIPQDISPFDYAMQQACATAGCQPTRGIACTPHDAATTLVMLLTDDGQSDDIIALEERCESAVLVLLLARTERPALACLKIATAADVAAADWRHAGGVLPSLAGVIEVAASLHGRRIPHWSRYWPPPARGRRTGLAHLADGTTLALIEPPHRAADRIRAAEVPPWDTEAERADDPVDLASGRALGGEPLGAAPVALVFSGFGSAHTGMLRRLTDALPPLADHLEALFAAELRRMLPSSIVYPPDDLVPGPLRGDIADVAAAEVLAHLVYGWIARELLGLRPRAAIGVSLGALALTTALCGENEAMAQATLATGGLVDSVVGLVNHAGRVADWANMIVGGVASELLAALPAYPAVHLVMQCDDRMLLLSGPHEEIKRLARNTRAVSRLVDSGMPYLHTPRIAASLEAVHESLAAVAMAIPRANLRGIDFYVSERPVRAGASAAAMAEWCRQVRASLLAPVDLPATIHAAWRSGCRIFVCCCPRDDTADWIGRILQGRPHLTVPLGSLRQNPWRALLAAAGLLRAHGALPADTPFDRIMRGAA
jgi:hypothetical protein